MRVRLRITVAKELREWRERFGTGAGKSSNFSLGIASWEGESSEAGRSEAERPEAEPMGIECLMSEHLRYGNPEAESVQAESQKVESVWSEGLEAEDAKAESLGAGSLQAESLESEGLGEAMHCILWQFDVATGQQEEFLRHYSPKGTWAQLFGRSPAFLGTELLQDEAERTRYVCIDCWRGAEDFAAFKSRHGDDYAALDEACERLTTRETYLGNFTAVV